MNEVSSGSTSMRTAVLAFFAVLLTAPLALANDAERIVEKMIEAHGGMEAWQSAPTVSFRHTLVSPQDPEDPWVSIETTEQGSRRTYQEWPRDGARIAWDGKTVWSTDWKRLNPPKFMVNLAYYFLNLPWLTQDPGVNLAMEGRGGVPNDDRDYLKVKMTFDPGTGETPDDYYVIYIDPDTYRMRATEFVVTYGPMLDIFGVPAEVKFIGPIIHSYSEFTTVDGLVVPVAYSTFTPTGQLYGEHTVENWSFSKAFDETRLEMPEGAVIDTSDPKARKATQ